MNESTGEISVPYNSLLPIFHKLAITGCQEICCVMSRFPSFSFEGANVHARGVRYEQVVFCRLRAGESGLALSATLIFHLRTRRMHPNFTFEKERCRIRNKRLLFKTVSFLCIHSCCSCLET